MPACLESDSRIGFSSDSTKVTSEFFSLSGPSSSEVIEVPVVAQVRHGIQITKPLKLFKVAHGVGQAVQGPATSLQFSHTAPNSIFLVPQLLTGEECDTLISHSDSADRELSESSSGGAQSGRPFRWMAHLWPPPLTELVADVVSNRLLPTLGLDDGPKIKLLVRCITRYTPGCVAPPHTDPGAFTAVVVLDDLTKDVGEEPPFLGGCTEFWPDEVDDAAAAPAAYKWRVTCPGIRPVEMYRTNISTFITHHVGMVRGCYTAAVYGGAPRLVVTASFIDTMANLTTPNYRYFASRKSTPFAIVKKWVHRGFSLTNVPANVILLCSETASKWPTLMTSTGLFSPYMSLTQLRADIQDLSASKGWRWLEKYRN